jgi:hypothetical protein
MGFFLVDMGPFFICQPLAKARGQLHTTLCPARPDRRWLSQNIAGGRVKLPPGWRIREILDSGQGNRCVAEFVPARARTIGEMA